MIQNYDYLVDKIFIKTNEWIFVIRRLNLYFIIILPTLFVCHFLGWESFFCIHCQNSAATINQFMALLRVVYFSSLYKFSLTSCKQQMPNRVATRYQHVQQMAIGAIGQRGGENSFSGIIAFKLMDFVAWKRISRNLRNSQNYQKCCIFSENFKIQLQTFRHKKI